MEVFLQCCYVFFFSRGSKKWKEGRERETSVEIRLCSCIRIVSITFKRSKSSCSNREQRKKENRHDNVEKEGGSDFELK